MSKKEKKIPKPVALIILDGFGLREEVQGNAVAKAFKPNFDRYWECFSHTTLTACGEAVGLPPGQMGNSEVGHLNIGAGRVVYQDLTRITKSIKDGDFYNNRALLNAIAHCKQKGTNLHICGLLSDGGVHSHIDHLFALIRLCSQQGVHNVYIHAFLDGRDVSPKSAKKYLYQLQKVLSEEGCPEIATIHGRYYAMDRDKRWDRIEKSYKAMVFGEGVEVEGAQEVVDQFYEQGIFDEFIQPTVITDAGGNPVATIKDNDALIFFNFRPDRAIQLSLPFVKTEFNCFNRGYDPVQVHFVSFTHYSEAIKGEVAFKSQHLPSTLGEVVSSKGYRQLRIAETEKYPHVTYFLNGGRETPYKSEDRILISSPSVATYDLKPEMSANEVTEALLEAIDKELYDFIVLNFANPDMVGHSGMLAPTVEAVEVVDVCLGKIVDRIHEKGGCTLITADHGNADEVIDAQDEPVTCHTTSEVPCIITKSDLELRKEGILADIAPTLLHLMDIAPPVEMTGESLIENDEVNGR